MFQIFLRKCRSLHALVRDKGVMLAAKITVDNACVYLLSKIYDFPAGWQPPLSLRPYRRTVAQVINDLAPTSVCEVGCGLGYILALLDARDRDGYDIDDGVVRAARLIRSRRIRFHHGSIEAVNLPWMDVLVLVNWIHEVSPDDLARQLLPLLPRTGYLMLDAIDPDNDFGYRYKHNFHFLAGVAELLSVTRQAGEDRSFQLFRVIR